MSATRSEYTMTIIRTSYRLIESSSKAMHKWLRKLNESSMVTVFAALSGSCAQNVHRHRRHGVLS